MSYFQIAWQWLTSAQQWHGGDGIPVRLAQHLAYTGIALGIAVLIALPAGLAMGHLRRGSFAVVMLANFGRALPTLGLLVLIFVLTSGSPAPHGSSRWRSWPSRPSWSTPTRACCGVDADLTDAARGMGMTEGQVLRKVEMPVATPLILLGLRISAIQVVATATIAAYIGLGGLGRYIIDGLARSEYNVVAGGAAVIVLLALAIQALFTLLRWLIVPVGLRRQAQAS